MGKLTHAQQAVALAGPIALLKFLCTRVANLFADEGAQIFGGRGITRTGMGRVIEGFNRAAKFSAILGGSEEVMADLGVKQAQRLFPDAAKL
jgi:alkylation response protein AidB-like acyl-CoA dehydrogenase